MKINVICNTDSLAIPTLRFLNELGVLCGVETLQRNAKEFVGPFLAAGIAREDITLLRKDSWQTVLAERLKATQPDMVWVFGFPWRIPAELLQLPAGGFLNFHFGMLPVYSGADPVFWQIRNREAVGGLCVHRMTEQVDEGPVVLRQEVPLIPGETYGIHCMRMGNIAVQCAEELITQYRGDRLKDQPQPQHGVPRYWKKPDASQLTIDWQNYTAEEIEWLVNASNPRYGGISVYMRNMEMRLLEVMPADVKDAQKTEPGTIIYADPVYGLIVSCRDGQFLRINVVHTREGYLSGVRLFGMGIRAGEKFDQVYENITVA